MKAELITSLEMGPSHPNYETGRKKFLLPGTIIDDPQCYKLVSMGCAVPADDECRDAVQMSDDEMKTAQHAYKRLAAGIAPEDFAAFDSGEMIGYNPDGSPIPGPTSYSEDFDDAD